MSSLLSTTTDFRTSQPSGSKQGSVSAQFDCVTLADNACCRSAWILGSGKLLASSALSTCPLFSSTDAAGLLAVDAARFLRSGMSLADVMVMLCR